MNLLILASMLLLCLIINIAIKKSDRQVQKAKEEFYEKERKANFVRKKPLDNLNYISVPDFIFSYKYNTDNIKVKDALDAIFNLKDCKIVNFSGISNTDLKLEYGTANITLLSEYDYNYTIFARSLQTLATSLYEENKINEAASILEYAISTKSDISGTYKLLGDIYKSRNDIDSINKLINTASDLDGLMKSSIIEYLNNLI